MDTEELKTLIAQMLREMAPGTEPAVKASEYKPTVPGPQEPTDAGEILDDIADIEEAIGGGPGRSPVQDHNPAPVSGGPRRRPGQRFFPGA